MHYWPSLLQPTSSLYGCSFPAFECDTLDQLPHALLALDTRDAFLKSLELFEFLGHDFSGKVKRRELRFRQSLLDGRVELGWVSGRKSDKGRRGGTGKASRVI